MIRNEMEYAHALERLEQEYRRLATFEDEFKEDFPLDQVARLMAPLVSFQEQLAEEVHVYERLKRGDLGDLTNLHGLGRLLVHLRIAAGITQRELAEKLNVHESQVSRDERNEYHGVTLDRASKIMDAIGANVKTKVVMAEHDRKPMWHSAPKKAKELLLPNERMEKAESLTPSVEVKNAYFPFAA